VSIARITVDDKSERMRKETVMDYLKVKRLKKISFSTAGL
jgi:hypothetical protein